ncbi:MAG: hypothetical protein HY049_00925 [Acidobacteria bacterium]|nr:hypothetical protein [Acidobacteriota bacterium]
MRLRKLVAALEKLHGRFRPELTHPFEMVLWENVAYLVPDAKRRAAYEFLKRKVGVTPAAILAAPPGALLEAARLGGMRPEDRVERLREAARIATDAFPDGDVKAALALAPAKAKRLFKRFPGFGDPGAERILLFNGAAPFLALESNGLRVLLRLGLGEESKSYPRSYRSAQEAAMKEEPGAGCDLLIRAHGALRAHGREICRAASPICEACPLAPRCRHFGAGVRR